MPPRKPKVVVENKAPVKKPPMQHRTREVGTLVDAVHQWPQFPGGADAFMSYLEKVGAEMVSFLPKGVKKAYVQVEFIIDKDGVPVNFKVLKSVKDSDELNDELIDRLEKMGTWKPALLHDKPVAKKMIQTVTIEVKEK
ncbi:MAG: hypothetical protein IPF69_12860 [Chitinophagaceae bacterium]|nr:hypothetical protein [Chitinophagaceae bacterium]